MKTKTFRLLTAAMLTLAALLAGQGAWAQTFTVTREGNDFKITRSGNQPAQKVYYRTVSLSAFGVQHYTVVSGELTFNSSETEIVKKVYVAEKTPTTDVYKYTAGATNNVYRTYRFEVLDESGFLLAYYDRDMSASKVATSALSGTFDLRNERTAAIHQEQSGILTITDGGYNNNPYGDSYANQRYLFQSSTAYYPASTQAYLSGIINAQLQMTLELNAAEVNDGYQYIQLLTDNTSDCDAITENTKPKDGDPGTINASRYMAGFEIYHGDEHTSYKTYTFPVLSAGNNAGATNPWGYGDKFNLINHKFNANCRATNGKIILNNDFQTLVLRFSASGSSTDNWTIKSINGKITAVDNTAPTVLSTSDIVVSPGPYIRGNNYYISVPFSEIVVGSPTLATSWGDATYFAGSGSNVLTFQGTITADAGTLLSVTGITGTRPTDLFQNNFSGSISKTFEGITCVEDPRDYTITYVDAVHGQNNVINLNPTSYNINTPDFQITAGRITREGYNLVGLYSDEGHTQKVTLPVTITQGSAAILKNITYYALWSEEWPGGGEGTEEDPFMITTPDHLVAVSARVNAGSETFSGKYFKLGSDIDMKDVGYTAIASQNTAWFSGIFDGDGYTISNVSMSSSDVNVGIFGGVSGGTIKNLVIDNASIVSTSNGAYAAIVVGHLDNAIISNCVVKNSSVNGNNYVGGVVGGLYDSNLTGCLVLNSDVSGANNKVGVYRGTNKASTLTGNNCRNVNVNNEVQNTIFILTPGDNVTLPARTGGTVIGHSGITTYSDGATIEGTDYYCSGATITLGYNGDVPDGSIVVYSANAGVISINTLTMPEADVTVTATIKAPTASIYIQAHSATYAGQTHYWATFFSNEGNYRLPAGAQAFTINRSKSNDKAMYRLGDGSVIPAGCAVVIMADMETIHLTLTDATATPQADNKLLGVGTDTAKASLITGNKKVYVMGVSGGIFGFHVFSGTTVPANKAFYVE